MRQLKYMKIVQNIYIRKHGTAEGEYTSFKPQYGICYLLIRENEAALTCLL
jgi:hypothetical protein